MSSHLRSFKILWPGYIVKDSDVEFILISKSRNRGMFNDIARKSVGTRYIANLLVWNASSPSTLLLCSNGFLTARYRSWLMAKVIIIVPNKDICPHGTAQYGTNHAHSVHPNFSWCNPKKKNGALIRNNESKSSKQIMRLLNNLTFLGIFKMVNTPVR